MRIGSCCSIVLCVLVCGFPVAAEPGSKGSSRSSLLPLAFEPEPHQVGGASGFVTRAGEQVIRVSGWELEINSGVKEPVRIQFAGARRTARPEALQPLPGKVNYLLGVDRAKWRTNVPTWQRVRYRDVYPGIDLEYYGNQRNVEYDLVLQPGADPKQLRIRVDGASSTRVSKSGDLLIGTEHGEMVQHRPVVYQEYGGARRPVKAEYRRVANHEYAFAVSDYDARRKLVIDPVVTFTASFGTSGATPVAVGRDAQGNAYLSGNTSSSSFPLTPGAYQTVSGFRLTGFVTKLNPGGDVMLYSTYVSGRIDGMAVDAAGHAYVTGRLQDRSAPGYAGCGPEPNGFVVKLGRRGDSAEYASCLPEMTPTAIALDETGAAYVAGSTTSPRLAVTPGAAQARSGNGATLGSDGFAGKLKADGQQFEYLTYLGGSADDAIQAIAVDKAGQAYVTGWTKSPDFPVAQARQWEPGGGVLMRSEDAAANWRRAESGLPVAPSLLVAHPNAAGVVLAVLQDPGDGIYRLYKTVDGGAAWFPYAPIPVQPAAVLFDTKDDSILYLVAAGTLYRTTNGGANWQPIRLPNSSADVSLTAGRQGSTLYFLALGTLWRSRDAGDTWSALNALGHGVNQVAVDAVNEQGLYVLGGDTLLKSADSGTTWAEVGKDARIAGSKLLVAAGNPSILYASGASTYLSEDGGKNWTLALNAGVSAIDSGDPHTAYQITSQGLYRIRFEGGAATSSLVLSGKIRSLQMDAGTSSRVYVSAPPAWDAFLTKINSDGSAWVYSTYFGGTGFDVGRSLAVDVDGNVTMVGSTNSTNLPTTESGPQRIFGGALSAWSEAGADLGAGAAPDAFVAQFDSSGQTLRFGTYLGGTLQEDGLGVTMDWQGTIYAMGTARSAEFPFSADSAKPRGEPGLAGSIAGTFLARIDGSEPAMDYRGYFENFASALAVDAADQVLLASLTRTFEQGQATSAEDLEFKIIRFGESLVRPQVATGGLVDPFTQRTGRAVPGSVQWLSGSHLASGTAEAAGTPLPLELLGTRVLIDGRPAPLLKVGPERIEFQVPYETPADTVVEIVVRTAEGDSLPAALRILKAAPNVRVDLETARAVATNEDGSVNGPEHPAAAGSVVTVSLTGVGPLENGPVTGEAAAGKARAVLPSSVRIGKKDGAVVYLGAAPGQVGVGQAEIRIPMLVSSEYPMVLTVGGVAGNRCLISVVAQ
ncbi:DUF7948 domain-containing protein [Paludibaculum fermentans]|uniref:SBBP repeat-containing protein n=1 Tax=Paludibaculum fermentans TaxID=1473598 RepID=A0A7S7SIV0_PALFE|nr:SBBP repeat-containing protein [Paludibaculum fermentans]QOY86048.1 SBBP repeat-containing protein [Paludibaculum fermentans]